ncbi:hypothetical protein [Collimonas sp. OK412]|jgi:hypothetical protein|nr:hypothetical protein [Collimonas sp. OK412]SFD00071.1 hypothetical protein SAMN04515619_1198 [Collimonas sp. OK412]
MAPGVAAAVADGVMAGVAALATSRRRSHPTFAIDDLGFRLARDL